jgi:hypothetical protein
MAPTTMVWRARWVRSEIGSRLVVQVVRESPDTVMELVPGLLDQAGATMARSQIELLGFVGAVEKICRNPRGTKW